MVETSCMINIPAAEVIEKKIAKDPQLAAMDTEI